MSDIILYTTLASSVLVILFIIALLRGKRSADSSEDESEVRAAAPLRRDVLAGAPVRRVGGRVVRGPRLQGRRRLARDDDDDGGDYRDVGGVMEDGDSDEGPAITVPTTLDDGTKIGAKKLRKLQEKAEKKAHRESELEEREERKKRQQALDEQRQKEAELEKLNEEKLKEEEQRLKAEKEKAEYEEYLKLKASFEVEAEGYEDTAGDKDAKDMLREFIEYIKTEKVVLLEDLAARFKLKTQDAIDRVEALMSSGELTGVIDDRGKVIYISRAELEAVAKFVKQRGRVQITELVECSNVLIDMNPKKAV